MRLDENTRRVIEAVKAVLKRDNASRDKLVHELKAIIVEHMHSDEMKHLQYDNDIRRLKDKVDDNRSSGSNLSKTLMNILVVAGGAFLAFLGSLILLALKGGK